MKLPGFIDSHLHFLGLGYILENIDLTTETSIEEIIIKLKQFTHKTMIIGRGWNQANFNDKRMITKNDLNQVSIDIPMVMVRVCGHVLTVNDKMLELANITESTPQIEGGSFDYETGVFTEKSLHLIYNSLPKPTISDLERYIINADKLLLKHGITHVASDDFSTLSIPYETVIHVFNKLYKENKIHVKVTEQVNLPIDQFKDFIEKGYPNKILHPKFKMGPLKILADGSLGGKTAALHNPYEKDPANLGILTYTDKELFEIVHLANTHNMDVVIHAIGDRAITQALNTLIKSIEMTKRYNHHHHHHHHHHAIIHAQLATNSQIDMMNEYHIGAIVQPIFLNSDIKIIEERIGKRSKESYLFKSMYLKGVHVGFSTDSPIEPVDPFKNIYSAVKRKSIKNPTLPVFLENEAFTIDEAIQCYTKNNLKFIGEPRLPKDDYIIVNQAISEDNLLNVEVLETYINHKLVYKKKAE